jgi:hypothetical protein
MIFRVTTIIKEIIISLNSINKLIFIRVNCGVLFEVRTKFLNVIQTTSFGFKWLNHLGKLEGSYPLKV